MTEQFIIQYIPQRIKQLGYQKHHLQYRDIIVEGNSRIKFFAYNELFFIIDDPPGISVESDYGIYDATENLVEENVHQHRGEIIITNPGSVKRKIKFVQVVIVN